MRRRRGRPRTSESQTNLRQPIADYIRAGDLRSLLTAPVIYSQLVPLVLLDLWVTIYQSICFPIYGIRRVRRAPFLIVDRHQLRYLNGIEKVNCTFCSYANGVLAYAREVAARTEQYWCPIKHRRRVASPHGRYAGFFEFGDEGAYHERLGTQRAALQAGRRHAARRGHTSQDQRHARKRDTLKVLS